MNDNLEPFPLLDMPVLVLVKTLRKMPFIDLLILSTLHPPLKRLIQIDVKRPNYGICIQTKDNATFKFVNLVDNSSLESIRSEPKSRMKSRHEYDYLKIGTSNCLPCRFRTSPEHRNWPEFVTHWNDPFKGARELYKQIHNLFSLPVCKAEIDLKRIEENYKPIFRWLSRIGSIPEMRIHGKNVDFQAYQWVLEHAKPSKKLTLSAEPYEYFKKGTLNVDVPEVRIRYGRWISVNNLLGIKSKIITISRSTISAEDLNGFLHRFKEGSNPNLNRLRIVFQRYRFPDYETCLEGLNVTEVDGNYFQWSFNLDNGDKGVVTSISRVNDELEGGAVGLEIVVDRNEEAN